MNAVIGAPSSPILGFIKTDPGPAGISQYLHGLNKFLDLARTQLSRGAVHNLIIGQRDYLAHQVLIIILGAQRKVGWVALIIPHCFQGRQAFYGLLVAVCNEQDHPGRYLVYTFVCFCIRSCGLPHQLPRGNHWLQDSTHILQHAFFNVGFHGKAVQYEHIRAIAAQKLGIQRTYGI